jgi:hypothetical protein
MSIRDREHASVTGSAKLVGKWEEEEEVDQDFDPSELDDPEELDDEDLLDDDDLGEDDLEDY